METSLPFYSSRLRGTLSLEQTLGIPIPLGLELLCLKKKLSYPSNSLTFYNLSWYLITTNVEYMENIIENEKCNSVYFKPYPICFIENYHLNGVKRKIFCLEKEGNIHRIEYCISFGLKCCHKPGGGGTRL